MGPSVIAMGRGKVNEWLTAGRNLLGDKGKGESRPRFY